MSWPLQKADVETHEYLSTTLGISIKGNGIISYHYRVSTRQRQKDKSEFERLATRHNDNMGSTTHELDDAALDSYVKDPRFSRVVELPATADQEALRISYADYGYHNEAHPELENVLLFFAPLLGSRMTRVALDDVAKKHKVRIINPDRPGFGQTPNVSVDKRLEVWRGEYPAARPAIVRRLIQCPRRCHPGAAQTPWGPPCVFGHTEWWHRICNRPVAPPSGDPPP